MPIQNFRIIAQTLPGDTTQFGFCLPQIGFFRGWGGAQHTLRSDQLLSFTGDCSCPPPLWFAHQEESHMVHTNECMHQYQEISKQVYMDW